MDTQEFFIQFQDHLAPKLDTYEQAIYLYVFRHSRLIGLDEITVGFKSDRKRIALGIGEKGKPMSEKSVYDRLISLQQKGCLEVISTTHKGKSLRVRLPHEMLGVIPPPITNAIIDLETMDFFNIPENRLCILKREAYRCFYTLKSLAADTFVIEHVVSRPTGNNSYRNCVAASREANNKKGAMAAEDFLRQLFREGYLSAAELQDRLRHLVMLQSGELKPPLV